MLNILLWMAIEFVNEAFHFTAPTQTKTQHRLAAIKRPVAIYRLAVDTNEKIRTKLQKSSASII